NALRAVLCGRDSQIWIRFAMSLIHPYRRSADGLFSDNSVSASPPIHSRTLIPVVGKPKMGHGEPLQRCKCLFASLRPKPLDDSNGLVFETVERLLSILADLYEVAVGITQVTAPFPAVIVQRLGKKARALVAPLFVAGPDVGDTQVEEAIHSVQIRRCFEENL